MVEYNQEIGGCQNTEMPLPKNDQFDWLVFESNLLQNYYNSIKESLHLPINSLNSVLSKIQVLFLTSLVHNLSILLCDLFMGWSHCNTCTHVLCSSASLNSASYQTSVAASHPKKQCLSLSHISSQLSHSRAGTTSLNTNNMHTNMHINVIKNKDFVNNRDVSIYNIIMIDQKD